MFYNWTVYRGYSWEGVLQVIFFKPADVTVERQAILFTTEEEKKGHKKNQILNVQVYFTEHIQINIKTLFCY